MGFLLYADFVERPACAYCVKTGHGSTCKV